MIALVGFVLLVVILAFGPSLLSGAFKKSIALKTLEALRARDKRVDAQAADVEFATAARKGISCLIPTVLILLTLAAKGCGWIT